MTNVTLICPTCGHTARRPLIVETAARGTHETGCEPATCPRCNQTMVRKNGGRVGSWIPGYLKYLKK